ncbi:MAG: hypothetical protein U0R80_09270 [Nocardioidaceae bacterium]
MRRRSRLLLLAATLLAATLVTPPVQAAPTAVPTAPTGLRGVLDSRDPNRILLSWTDPTPMTSPDNETGFEVQRCTGADCTDFATLIVWPTGGFDLFGYSDGTTTKTEGTTYTYRVRGINDLGASEWSATTTATTGFQTPSAPTGLTATYTGANRFGLNGNTVLRWLDNATNETAYFVTRCHPFDCLGTRVDTALPAGSTSYVDTTVVDGEEYLYFVSVRGASGLASSSPTIKHQAGRGLPAPTRVSATLVRGGIRVQWANRISRPVQVWRCDTAICRDGFTGEVNPGTFWFSKAVLPAGSTRFVDRFATTPATLYTYRLRVTTASAVSPSVYVAVTTP